MKYFFKIISLIGLMITSVIFGMVIFAQKTIPDSIHLVESEKIMISEIFSLNVTQNEDYVSANTQSNVIDDRCEDKEYTLDISLLNTIPVKSSSVTVSKRQYVVPGGDVFGIKLYTNGAVIVGMDDVQTSSGARNPGKEAGLETGDVITALNGEKITTVNELTKFFQNTNDKTIRVTADRNGKPFEATLTLAVSESDGRNKAGLWVRDSTAGVGTVTYYNKNTGVFGGLGHAVCDVDTGKMMPLLYGDAMSARISGCYKGTPSATGELCGVFTNKKTGDLKINCECGIYGIYKEAVNGQEIPVAAKQEITAGPAQIISTVDINGPKYYDIEIVKVFLQNDSNNKNMIIKITDPELIEKTGGIVQGMSGSPIIQNGMLVGAVTHVFVNDPLQGYGIFAENMLKISNSVEDEITRKAS